MSIPARRTEEGTEEKDLLADLKFADLTELDPNDLVVLKELLLLKVIVTSPAGS